MENQISLDNKWERFQRSKGLLGRVWKNEHINIVVGEQEETYEAEERDNATISVMQNICIVDKIK